MGASPRTHRAASDLVVRALREDDLPAVDRVRRLAFGRFLGLPDPMRFRGDADPVRTRFLADPAGSFVAELGGDVVGSNFVVDWGSVGFFGPLSVHPDHWDRGIAQQLVEPVLEALAWRGCRHVGLFTFGHSPKHLALYQRFGFWPRFPTAIMSRPVIRSDPPVEWAAFSGLPEERRDEWLVECRALADGVYDGLDLSREIRTTIEQGLGDTVLVTERGALIGFAVCHIGANTEAGSDSCYVKFGAVRPGPDAGTRFVQLVGACEALAAARGVARLAAGANTARREAYRTLLDAGFRIDVLGLAMDRPDEPAYNQPGNFVIDDWR